MADFSRVRRDHVVAAAARIDRDGVPPRRAARSTVVIIGGRTYPAKYTLGLAWEEAVGEPLDSEEFTGGLVTAQILTKLGFDVEHDGQKLKGNSQASPAEARTPSSVAPVKRAPVSPAGAQKLAAVSVSVQGGTSPDEAENARRVALLGDIVNAVTGPRRPADAAVVVLPGGYLRLGSFVGNLDEKARRRVLEGADFAHGCKAAALALQQVVPGALLVVGIDSVPGPGEWADQMCVAWSPDGVVGVGRKVFPLAGREANGLVVNAADYACTTRVVDLPGGHRAVLCSCYDGFGVSDPRARAWPVERLRVGRRVLGYEDPGFDEAWEDAVAAWCRLIAGADTALIAIHGFGSGTSTMWQRHGIATASAALDSGLAIAGAHFTQLPSTPDVQVLASAGVPESHLDLGHHREAESLLPASSEVVGRALVRWFHWS